VEIKGVRSRRIRGDWILGVRQGTFEGEDIGIEASGEGSIGSDVEARGRGYSGVTTLPRW
jgi:hypothetical protein